MKTMDLKRELNLIDVFSITTGSMICSGLFILPGIAHAKAGPAAMLSYLLAGLLAIPAMLSAAELVTAMPKAGGIYYFVSRSMGYGTGTVAGFARWFSISFKSAFALIGMGAYAALITDIPITVVALFSCIFFIAINLLGIKLVGRIQVFMVYGLLTILFFYIVLGWPAANMENFSPFYIDFRALLATAGFVFISYGGLLVVTGLAEEVKKPEQTIPLGMFLSLVVVGAFYALVVFVTTGVLETGLLENSLTPVSEAARTFMGPFGMVILAIAAFLALITTTNAGIASASRYPLAMSRDGILPDVFQRVGHKYGTPYLSILFTGGFMLLVILLLRLELLVEVASTILILTYILVNLAVLIMRKTRPADYQPKFRAPFYPWLQLLGITGLGALIAEMGTIPILLSGLFILAALAWYRFYAWPRLK